MYTRLDEYGEIWLCDFEFRSLPGERPDPVCMVAHEFRSGRRIWLWQDELLECEAAPFSVGPDSLFVAYYASAELGCFLALGWELPERVLDLFVEFRRATNGLDPFAGNSLLARWRGTAWTRSARLRKNQCASSCCVAVRGLNTSGEHCSTIAPPTLTRWPNCCRRWSLAWTPPAPWLVAVDTCGRLLRWNGLGFRSTLIHSPASA